MTRRSCLSVCLSVCDSSAPTHTITGRKIRQPEPQQQENRPAAYDNRQQPQQQQREFISPNKKKEFVDPQGYGQAQVQQRQPQQQQQQQGNAYDGGNGGGLHGGRSSTRLHAPPGMTHTADADSKSIST